MKKEWFLTFSVAVLSVSLMGLVFTPAQARQPQQDDVLAHGKYIATIAGCTTCHTPFKAEYNDPSKLTLEQIKIIALDEHQALDKENGLLSGGRAFDLGPAGAVFTRNLTPDKATGLGEWTDEQIKLAVRTGVRKDGTLLFPVMPYHVYNTMADADLDAVIAYLRSVKPVNHQVPQRTVSVDGLQPLTFKSGVVAPDPSNKAARGSYIVNSVGACTDCHTPIDPQTGAPQMEKYLAGQQPYEGPWGIVYGGNITPDKETGIGNWTEEEVKRAVVAGIGKDGRRLILMPWHVYSAMTPEDADAVAYYLKNVLPAVSNKIPAASLKEEFNIMAENKQPAVESAQPPVSMSPMILWVVAIVIIALVSVAFYFLRKKVSA